MRFAVFRKGVQFGNPQASRENQVIRANLRIDSRELGNLRPPWSTEPLSKTANRSFEAIRTNHSNVLKIRAFLRNRFVRIDLRESPLFALRIAEPSKLHPLNQEGMGCQGDWGYGLVALVAFYRAMRVRCKRPRN